MSVHHSIVPLEIIFEQSEAIQPRVLMRHNDMLVEVEAVGDDIVLSRIIDAPLENYLNDNYLPGTIIGRRYGIL